MADIEEICHGQRKSEKMNHGSNPEDRKRVLIFFIVSLNNTFSTSLISDKIRQRLIGFQL